MLGSTPKIMILLAQGMLPELPGAIRAEMIKANRQLGNARVPLFEIEAKEVHLKELRDDISTCFAKRQAQFQQSDDGKTFSTLTKQLDSELQNKRALYTAIETMGERLLATFTTAMSNIRQKRVDPESQAPMIRSLAQDIDQLVTKATASRDTLRKIEHQLEPLHTKAFLEVEAKDRGGLREPRGIGVRNQ